MECDYCNLNDANGECSFCGRSFCNGCISRFEKKFPKYIHVSMNFFSKPWCVQCFIKKYRE